MKTRAAVLYKLNTPLVIESLDLPDLLPGQVLVQMRMAGICRKQLDEIEGIKGEDRYLPHLLGHEGSGVVEAVGRQVAKVKPGDSVVLTWIKGRGMDVPSTIYRKSQTKIHAGAVTAFGERMVVSENRLVRAPKSLPFHIGAILGCAVATGAGIVFHTLDVKANSSLVVFGVGGIGSAAILAGRMRGCVQIIAVDISEEKLRFAKQLGATHTVDAKHEAAAPHVHTITGGKGADYAVEATGMPLVMESAFESIRDGGTAVIAGNPRAGDRIRLDPYGLIRGKKILGTWGGETNPDRDIPQFIAAYQKGNLPLDVMVGKRYPLDHVNGALREMKQMRHLGRQLIAFI